MPTINEVLERVNRARPDAMDDDTKAAWLIELDGQLFREVIETHVLDGDTPDYPKHYPEDGDKALLVGAPHDGLYDLYVMSKMDFYNREADNYNNSALAFNTALADYKKDYHRRHMPISSGGYRNVF